MTVTVLSRNLKNILFYYNYEKTTRSVRCFSNRKCFRVLFFGSDYIGLKCLEKINNLKITKNIISKLDVVTTNTAKNRSFLEKYADSQNLNLLSWPILNIQNSEYDIGLIAAFGHLINKDVLEKFPLGIVNVHPSLLPRWRGAAPLIHTLLNGDDVTGVSLMKIKADKFDVGEIISQKITPVNKDETLPQLTTRLSAISADMLAECVLTLPESLANTRPQDTHGITYARKISKSISKVRWTDMDSTQVYNLYRALFGLYDLTSRFQDKKVKLYDAFLCIEDLEDSNKAVGTLDYCNEKKALKILCRDKKYIYFKLVKIGTKNKRITALDFYNGYIKNMPSERKSYILCS